MIGIADDIVLDADQPWWEDLDWEQPINWEEPLNQGLVSDWKVLPQGFGGPLLFDLLGKNHGTLTNGPTWGGGLGGRGVFGSLRFDANNDYVGTGTVPQLARPSTVILRFRTINTPGAAFQWLFAHDSGANDGWRIGRSTGNLFNITFGGVAAYDFAANTLVNNDWYTAAITVPVNSGTAKLYFTRDSDGSIKSDTVAVGTMGGTPSQFTFGGLSWFSASSDSYFASVQVISGAITESAFVAWAKEHAASYPTTLNRVRKPAPSIFIFPAAGGAAAELAAAITANATLSAALTTEIPLASAVSGTASVAAALTTEITAATSLTAAAALAAALTTEITAASAISATAAIAGDLTTEITAAAALPASATLAAALTTEIALAAGLSGSASLTGELTVGISFDASLSATAALAAALSTEIPLAAAVSAQAAIAADLTVGIGLEAAISATASMSGELTTEINLLAGITAQAVLSAELTAGGAVTLVHLPYTAPYHLLHWTVHSEDAWS